ncbi:expressed unknown protein [Seminavis robusta]|uniref:Uncharacterized protein n=1 Tax=Seminavis robusta TaxID=568900 RepID=A0A9N8HG05_9STRA|nr:expressed unknown protein [Seminavis robusta]|eukprot:Sro550_g164760.1 n/a (636) ;mRNA; r:46729-48636
MDPGSGAFLFCSADELTHERLRQNDEDFVDLQVFLSSTSNLHDFTDALWHNTSIQEALLLIHESFGDTSEHEILLFFAVLGRLPQLARLYFNTYRFPFVCRLPVRAFTNVSRSARKLIEFKLWRTDICLFLPKKKNEKHDEDSHEQQDHQQQQEKEPPPQQQLQDWANALAACRNLREFRIIKCRLTNSNETNNPQEQEPTQNTTTNNTRRNSAASRRSSTTTTSTTDAKKKEDACCGCTLDPLLESLAQLPQLREVELSATKLAALGNLSHDSLKKLISSSHTLQSLSLSNFDLSEEAVVVIGQSLLRQHDDTNTTQHQHQHHRRPMAQSAVSAAPRRNRNNNNNNNTRRYSTSNIRNLRLAGVGSTASMLTKPIREAFRQVLQYNYKLERLFLFDNRNLQEEIAFYLKLNKLGRQRLLRQDCKEASKTEWMDVLVHVRDDLDCLFYFLSINPLLLQHHYCPTRRTKEDNNTAEAEADCNDEAAADDDDEEGDEKRNNNDSDSLRSSDAKECDKEAERTSQECLFSESNNNNHVASTLSSVGCENDCALGDPGCSSIAIMEGKTGSTGDSTPETPSSDCENESAAGSGDGCSKECDASGNDVMTQASPSLDYENECARGAPARSSSFNEEEKRA